MPTIKGSRNLVAGVPVNLNLQGEGDIAGISRAVFSTNNGARVGVKLFNSRRFCHAELNSVGLCGLAEDLGETWMYGRKLTISGLAYFEPRGEIHLQLIPHGDCRLKYRIKYEGAAQC